MDQGPLVRERIDAGARFLGEFQKYLPVRIAFWLRDEGGPWYLYIASEKITADNIVVAYGEVIRLANRMQDPWFDPFRVKAVGPDDRVGQAALEMCRRYPGRTFTHFLGTTLGGVPAEDAYIYPPMAAVPA